MTCRRAARSCAEGLEEELKASSMRESPYIAIIDDDPDDVAFLEQSLAECGPVSIASFRNGSEALPALKRLQAAEVPQLIVLDLVMPLKDGFEVIRELGQQAHLAPIPIVILTSSFLKRDEDRCRRAGCAAFFTKPMSMEEYRALGRKILALMPAAGGFSH